MPQLPPGPSAPAIAQTVEWIVRPTDLLRRAKARYGETFTLNTVWYDAPLVCIANPDDIQAVYKAPNDVLLGGEGASFLEPFVGPRSVLILSGPEHLKQRRLALPPFHGDALKRWATTIAEIANQELDTWQPNTPFKAMPRMQALALEVIQRVVFGSRDEQLRRALRHALDMTGSTWRLVAMSLVQHNVGPYRQFLKAVKAIDELVYQRIDQAGDGDAIVDVLKNAGATREELRDQLVTLLAAGHETTATGLAWALERLARHPEAQLQTDQQVDAFVKEVLRTRPVLSITARKTLQPYTVGPHTIPEGVYVAPCLYLAQRRPETWPDPTQFKPERFLTTDAPEPYTFIPFGGGTRRCLGAAFATLEMREVLKAVASRFTLRPTRAEGERMRRRSVTLAPARGAEIIADPLA